MKNAEIYAMVADKIIENMKQGVIPWQRPWYGGGRPANFVSKREYSGINTILLGMSEFKSRYWMTFNQVSELGGKVKKGAKSQVIVFWNFRKIKDEKDPENIIQLPMLRYYRVFNFEQTEGIENPDAATPVNTEPRDKDAMKMIESYLTREGIPLLKPRNGENAAYYNPREDHIALPEYGDFKSSGGWFATIFHEAGHSTGIKSRLDRGLEEPTRRFGSHLYSEEELVAEFTACFLMNDFNILSKAEFNNSTAYIQGWVKKFQDQPSMLVKCAGQATKAANFILGVVPEEETESE